MTAESIRFRRSLTLFQRFDVVTRVLGWDEKSIYLEQRFVRGDTVVANALITGRFLRSGGSVTPAEVLGLAGLDPAAPPPMPGWAKRLAAAQEALAMANGDPLDEADSGAADET